MAATSDTLDLSDLPPELVRFVAEEAERDADRVIEFLSALGLSPPPGEVRFLPPDLMLNLGAAMRLLAWESTGIGLHREKGLPSAREATRRVFAESVPRDGSTRDPNPWLSQAVFQLTIDHFAWTAQRDLQAEIRLDFADEDALVDVMAQFLWTHRHNAPLADRGLMT